MDIRFADSFWIEAGKMSGPPQHRHQLELPWDLVQFFDNLSIETEVFPLGLPGGPVWWRPLTYRGTDYGQWTDIWRLGLLTPRMGGPDYVDRVIRFQRQLDRSSEGWQQKYELYVEDAGSAEANAWQARSVELDSTGGHAGRNCGWF